MHDTIIQYLSRQDHLLGETARIAAFKPDEIESDEEKLLSLSKKMMAHLPFDDIDLLIVDEMGKDISGVGIDPNITGRNRSLILEEGWDLNIPLNNIYMTESVQFV